MEEKDIVYDLRPVTLAEISISKTTTPPTLDQMIKLVEGMKEALESTKRYHREIEWSEWTRKDVTVDSKENWIATPDDEWRYGYFQIEEHL
jgi:hypothetical protein